MELVNASRWKILEERTGSLFLVGGVLLAVAAVAAGVQAVQGVDRSAVGSVIGPAGLAVAFVGLLGLYPGLVERTRWLARGGAVFAVLGTIGYAGISVGNLVSLVAGNPEGPPDWATIFVPLLMLGTLFGFLLVGIASLRTDVHSRNASLLLLVPTAAFVLMMAGEITGFTPVWDNFVLTGGQALALLGLGYILRTDGTRTGRGEPAPDSAAK